MSETLWIVALIGGLVALDTTAGPQVMISQPIVACPVLGLLLGDLETGLLFGTVLELIWIGTVPAGASRFFDSNMAAVAAAGAAIWAMQRCGLPRPTAVLLSLGVVLPIGLLGSRMTVGVRKLNSHLIRRADSAARSGKSFRVSLYHGCGAGFSFVRGAFLSLLGTVTGGLFVSALAGFLPPVREDRLAIALMALIGLGGAVGLKLFGTKRLAPWIAFGLSIGMLVRLWG
ncbi:MAG: PTS sugar transporter subunit IIC [Candidatus Latescibacteria bacterium]|nr:PTS sugar transporter subunit IIC [Candidatus Latescibacterota bacterium]